MHQAGVKYIFDIWANAHPNVSLQLNSCTWVSYTYQIIYLYTSHISIFFSPSKNVNLTLSIIVSVSVIYCLLHINICQDYAVDMKQKSCLYCCYVNYMIMIKSDGLIGNYV